MIVGLELFALGFALIPVIWIGLLPRVFFRPGRRNLQWWLNALPFWVAGTAVAAELVGVLPPAWPAGDLPPEAGWATVARAVAALGASAGALFLMRATVAVHQRPLDLWHQTDDRPEHLVRDGPYAWVRHPFYSSFILALAGCLLAVPHVVTSLALVWGAVRLRGTAIREEARFLASDLAGEYRSYMAVTGRLLPRIGARRASAKAEARSREQRPEPLR